MKTTQLIMTEIEIATIEINISPRYIGDSEDDDVPSDMPLLSCQQWIAVVDIDTGKIDGWPEGEVRNLWAKVCDAGTYTLTTPAGFNIAQINGYVPHGVVPGEYGDYIDLKINGDGFITNWPKNPCVEEFFNQD